MTLLDVFKNVLGIRKPKAEEHSRPEPVPERIVLPVERYRSVANEIAGIQTEISDARTAYCNEREKINRKGIELYKKALSGFVADIPGSFRGTFHGVPGTFEVNVWNSTEKNMFEPGWDYEIILRQVSMIFQPVLFGGISIRYLRDSIWIASDELCYIELWPQDKPWPGTRFVSSLGGLELSKDHDEKDPLS